MNLLHVIILTTSLVFGFLAIYVAGISEAGLDCFITATPAIWRQVLFYIPVYVTMVIVAVLYTRVIGFLRSSSSMSSGLERRLNGDQFLMRIGLYPVAYFFVWIPAVVHRLYQALGPEQGDAGPEASTTEFALTLAQAISWSSQGFINFVVYGLVSRRLGCLCCRADPQDAVSSKPVAEPTYDDYDVDVDPPEVSVRASVNLLTSPILGSLRE